MVFCGIDIIEVDRIKKALTAATGENFKNRIFTENECRYCEDRGTGEFRSFAGRFAAKEAVMKALGTGIGRDTGFTDIEILNDKAGKPQVFFSGKCADLLRKKEIIHTDVSITHIEKTAMAMVVMESRKAD